MTPERESWSVRFWKTSPPRRTWKSSFPVSKGVVDMGQNFGGDIGAVVISSGGASDIAATAQSRDAFAQSCLDLLLEQDLDLS